MPEPLFDNLYRDTEQLHWAPTEQVRRRGRQRSRRLAAGTVLASAVAVAVVASGVVALAGRPDVGPVPPPPATNSPTPSPTPSPNPPAVPTTPPPSVPPDGPSAESRGSSPTIPAEAMLQLSDLPTGFQQEALSRGEGDWTLAFAASLCEQSWNAFGLPHVADRYVAFRSPQVGVLQEAKRYRDENAARYLDRVRAGVESCSDRFSVLDEDFAGEESLVIQFDAGGLVSLYVVVRQDDLVTTVWRSGQPDQAAATRLGERAADRLCAGTEC
ncbi:hypothetical protein O7627_00295 [Solwaraspora sp. WMMD1047]|uniref:hypothetical protein n=1 Tax=Solwaraspora sp. WMMD1047 TaxID=3016102 RepID=UPI0024177549|nr:hypothetical protein [Solwaraspora sp. WMMD1047]MDG4827742.1 hypothetical protein [Solwaraspora sp. WMMD1047]